MEQKHGEGFEWTEAAVRELRRLKGKNYSAGQIAKQLGGGLTRNAVIGKMDRLGLTGRKPKQKRPEASDYDKATDAGNKGKGKVLDLSPPEYLAVRRFSWEVSDAQPNP